MKPIENQSKKSDLPGAGSRRARAGEANGIYLSHPSSLLHDMGEGHPEQAGRITAVFDALVKAGLMGRLRQIDAPAASDEQILRVHSDAHLNRLSKASPDAGMIQLDADTAMNQHSLKAARHAAGALVHAVEMVLHGEANRAFCNVRPPGHHAEARQAMGFCLFNNVAIGAAHALEACGLDRVAIVDFDVHHGNGTEDIFAQDPRVLMVSTFQTPLYPGSGNNPLGPNMFNEGLAPGSDGQALRRAVQQVWAPALAAFKPQLIMISAGFDAHRDDPLAQLNFTEDDFAWVTGWLLEQSHQWCQGRIVSTLEGGYSLDALGRSASAHVNALLQP